MIPQTLGPYQIITKIGEGGMGEVYRARDTRLDRDVALKVLPEAFTADPDRLARFEREAKVLASLNHPNIGGIHGLEESDGIKALVLEYIDGPTLADRIAQGPIPVDEALPIARQIAEALEAAHQQGVIHRDLKPANIKVRADGTVKVLDFGLAKAFEPEAGSASASVSPTISLTAAATRMGMVIGTAAYMAPEQAIGKVVDKRADVWAFGAVLFEMLTGQKPFVGDDVSDTLALVLKFDPEWDALPDDTPPRLRQLVQTCLQKDTKHRVADMQDVRLAMQGAFETAAPQVAEAGAGAQPAWRQPLPVAVSAAVAALLVAGLAAWSLWPTAEPAVVSRFDYVLPEGQAFRNTGRPIIALSPDARAFAYNTAGGLYLRAIDELEARLIPGTEPTLTSPFFSPDGQQVAYWDLDGQLTRIGTTGGAPVVIADLASNPYGASWGPDGTILIGQPEGILRVPATGGTSALVVPALEGERLYGPSLMPDGESVLFSATTAGWDDARIVVQSLATGERAVLVERGNDARYVPTGHLVYALETGLFAVAFDTDRLSVSGGAVPLVQGVMRAGAGQTGVAHYSVSAEGTLIYVAGSTTAARTPVWVDREGREEPIAAEPGAYGSLRISPDGTRVVIYDYAGNDLWVWNFASATRTRLTVGERGGSGQVWTPDGARIAYSSRDGDIAWKAANNTGTPERIAEAPGEGVAGPPSPYFFAPTGTALVFGERGNPETEDSIGLIALEDGAESAWLLDGPFDERNAELSPDGRWMAYQSDESGQFEIYVRPFPNVDDDRVPVSNAGGFQPLWSRDGRELFYLEGNPLMSAAVQPDGPVFSVYRRTPLLDWPYFAAPLIRRTYDVSVDGQRFLALRPLGSDGAARSQIIVVQDWFEELKRLVPVP